MLNVCIVADEAEPLALEALARLRAEGHECERLDPRGMSGLALATFIERCQAVLVIRPRESQAFLATGLALGRGTPLLVLDSGTSAPEVPGVERISTLDDMLGALRTLGDMSVFLHPDQFRALGPCEAVDWLARMYPEGGHTRDWTLEEQLRALRLGAAPWLLLARKRRLVRIWSMDGVDLRKADLHDADFRRLSFAGAWLEDADLSRANLLGTGLRGAHLARARLDQARLRDADLWEADLTEASLRGAELVQARMARIKLAGANLSRADLSAALLANADLRGATLTEANLMGMVAPDANFEGCDLSHAHLTRANLRGARLAGARLTGANLEHTDLSGADLTGAALSGALLSNATGLLGSRRE